MASGDDQSTDYHNRNLYGYTPTRWVGFVFVIIFILSTAWHIVQGVRSRLWWLFWTIILAGLAESIGWVARIVSSYSPTKFNPYLIQNLLLILAPIPLVAASFIILGQIIRRLGQQYSRLNAKWYARIFVTCDIISLMVQGGGGGMVSSNSSDPNKTKLGTNIVLGGIIFQTIAITIYMILATEFVVRYVYKRPVRHVTTESAYPLDRSMKQMLGALALSSLCVYVRSWYRTIEFADGWDGRIVHTERYFVIMDGAMIALATIIMNICHPGRLLGPRSTWSEEAIYRREKDQLNGYDRQGRPFDAYEAVRLNGSDERV